MKKLKKLLQGPREQEGTTLSDQAEVKRKETKVLPPLVNAITTSVKKNAAPLNFPGHKRGIAAPSSLVDAIGIGPFLHDATELPELDSFGYPIGPLLDAQQMTANLFGASQTWFLVCGTTCGILAAIMSTCSHGDTLILARNSHVSAASATVLCGAQPKYILHEHNLRWDIAGGVTPLQVKIAIEELEQKGKKAARVFITSPTYNGLFLKEQILSYNLHTVLCSFSQSSMLHLFGDRIDRDRVHKCLQSLQTTSPNWLLLASLDATRDELSKNPNTLFNEVMELVQQVKELINHIPGVSLFDLSCFSNNFSYMDPLRMTIGVQELGLSGLEAYNILSASHGNQPELIGTQSFTLAFSLGTTKDHTQRLANGLKYLSNNFFQEEMEIIEKKSQLYHGIERLPLGEVYMSCTPREAFFARKKKVNFEKSIGEVCGEFICPFPPGIPVLIPGEIITKRAMDYLVQVRDQGAFLKGAVDPLLSTVVVCDF
nr:uncharacterized protein LOC101250132 [Solanum lycopersicum]